MIDLNKKYQAADGCEVELFKIIDNKVFGAHKTIYGEWYPSIWNLDGTNSYTSDYHLKEIPNFNLVKINERLITYFGFNFLVSKFFTYIATDLNGHIYAYERRPQVGLHDYCWGSGGIVVILAKYSQFEGDWKQSLMEIPND
jgi:hypothetical protein